MSEIKVVQMDKLELVNGDPKDHCLGCYFQELGFCPDDDCYGKKWVENEKPQSPWTSISDAELVDGEQYRIAIGGKNYGVGIYYEPLKQFFGTSNNSVHFHRAIEEVTHVIHLDSVEDPEVLS